MNQLKLAFVLLCLMPLTSFAQTAESNFRLYDAKGNVVKFEGLINALENADVVFLGEQHDDPTAHALQLEVLKRSFETFGKQRPIALSMEMFERDVQPVVDEYLADIITETHLISSGRAWDNYQTDYKPLVEFAKANKLRVIAANAPRRYVNRVSRLGKTSLDVLSPATKSVLAPLPYAKASSEYSAKFSRLMGGMGGANHGESKILDAQSLWDATMAYAVSEHLAKNPNALVIHLNGGFHSENRLGAPEHLLRYNPKARVLVVTMRSDAGFPTFDRAKHENLGDFVILTNPELPRSFGRN